MSTPFYDLASLVVVPSGYKASKVYAQKPLTTDGQLTFSRSTGATRVNSAGLIEKVRTNLVLQSETFDNASWAKTFGASITANTAANPLTGTQTADTIYADATNDFHYISQSITYSAGEATLSIYAKANGYSWFVIDSGFSNAFGYFNITTGAVGTKGSACTTAITSVGSGWYRCSVTFTATASASSLFLSIRNADNGGSFLGDGVSGFFIYGAQAEMGVATSYIATTSAAVSVGPVANVPRLDYLNSSCPKLNLEPQRTNLATYSEQAVQYSQIGATIGSNVATSPDGYTNADSIIEDGSNGNHAFYNFGLTTFTAAAYTASVFAKKGSRDWCALQIYDGTQGFTAFFNLNTGVAGTIAGVGTSTITNYGNGWYRCTITATTLAGSTGGIAVYSAAANGSTSYAGTNGLTAGYFYGWQLELGAYATSYIPTLGAAVTKSADTYQKAGFGNTSTAGTLYYEFQNYQSPASANGMYMVNLFAGSSITSADFSTAEGISIINNGAAIEGRNDGYATTLFSFTPAINATVKVALRYDGTNVVAFVNGVKGTVFSDTAVGAKNAIRVNNGENATHATKQLLFFPSALTDAQCIELTTL